MKFKEYVTSLNKLLEESPEVGELTAMYSVDDEYKFYNEVYYTPTLDVRAIFDDSNGPFYHRRRRYRELLCTADDTDKLKECGYTESDFNGIIIN